jgi:hypothetical protein
MTTICKRNDYMLFLYDFSHLQIALTQSILVKPWKIDIEKKGETWSWLIFIFWKEISVKLVAIQKKHNNLRLCLDVDIGGLDIELGLIPNQPRHWNELNAKAIVWM